MWMMILTVISLIALMLMTKYMTAVRERKVKSATSSKEAFHKAGEEEAKHFNAALGIRGFNGIIIDLAGIKQAKPEEIDHWPTVNWTVSGTQIFLTL